jgi:hypothetical protein
MANLLFATRESDSLRSENPKMSQPSCGLVEVQLLWTGRERQRFAFRWADCLLIARWLDRQ